MKTIEIFSKTLSGKFKKQNQDVLLSTVNKYQQILIAVADGVGSYWNSQAASQTVCKVFKELFLTTDFRTLRLNLSDWFKQNVVMSAQKQLDNFVDRVATTLTAVIFFQNKWHVLHVGNTRLYQFKNEKRHLLQLTRDHNFTNNNDDTLSWLQGKKYLQNAISNYQNCYVDYHTFVAASGYLLLTSDGLHDFVQLSFLEQIIASEQIKEKAKIEALFNQAINAGSFDDITGLLIKIT